MQALLSASAPADEVATPRVRSRARALYARALTLAIGLCAAMPVIAAAARALHEGWQPVADRGIIATRAFDVFSSHTPLVGQYSFTSTVIGKLTYSLGPMLYWLLAPAARIGAPQSFVWTMAVVNVGSILGAVALARRRGGMLLMLAAAIGIALMCRSLVANNFYDTWNPSAGLFPLLLLIFVSWSLACGEYRLLALAVGLVSFLVQCEDGFVAPAVGAFAVGLAGFAVWWLGQRRKRAARPSTVWRWLLAAVLVLIVCWTPPIIDQVAHEGNIGHVLQAVGKRKSPLGATVGAHAVIRTVGVTPWWLTRPSDPFVRKRDVRRGTSTLASLSTAVILGWLLLAIALAIRRRRTDVAAGAALALVLCLAIFSIANATPSTPRFLAETLGYTLWSATTVGMFVWLIALWAASELSGAGALAGRAWATAWARAQAPAARPRAVGTAFAAVAAVALAALAGVAGAAAGTPDEHAFEFAALKTINARLGAVPRGHSVYLNAKLDGLITPLRPEITYELRRRGVRPLGSGAYLRTGHWYELSEHPYDYIVWVYDYGHLPVKGARVIAVAHISSGGRRHTVEVAISPAPARARASGQASATGPGERTRTAGVVGRASSWSPPSTLGGCALAPGPRVAFPSEGPSSPTGPGAIVWASPPSCDGASASSSPASASLSIAALGAPGLVSAISTRSLGASAPAGLATVGGSLGRVVVSAGLVGPGAGATGRAAVLQGRSTGPFGSPALLAAEDVSPALTRAYLGDVAIATVAPGPAIAVRVERYFRSSFERARLIPIPAGRVTALTATMDYRSDVLVAWQQNGAIYAHMLRASMRPEPTQRVGASAPDPRLRALVSDNDHGMVAWSSTSTAQGSPARTREYIDLSQAGVRFVAPRLLASFTDPANVGLSSGSLALARLSTENVLLAWTDVEHGHYVVRAAPAVFAGTRPSALVSDADGQAVLDDLAPGPAAEAVVLWSTTPRAGAFDPSQTELWAARAVILQHDRPAVSGRERVAPAAPNVDASVAVDPADDRAVAAWLTRGSHPSIQYASGFGAAGYRPGSAPASLLPQGGGTHWLRITVGAVAVAGLTAIFGLVIWRRRRQRRA
ncbi:MAG: hypothetical protein ACHQAV_06665 [Solirubrobacterales bacterium]